MSGAQSAGAPGLDASRVWKGLYQGSFPRPGRTVAKAGFTTLILCAEELQPRSREYPGIECVAHVAIDDGELTKEELERALTGAGCALETLAKGHRVLVTCAAGLNRSGLVTALVMHGLTGMSGKDCVEHVRKHRSGALRNESFVRWLSRIPAREVRLQ
jgi:hypothetical protein